MFCLKIFTINFGGEEEGDGQKSVQSLTSLRLCLCMWSTGALLQFCLIWSLNKEVTVCKDPFWIRVYHHSFHWRIPKSRINNLNDSLEGLYLYIFQNNIKKCWKGDPDRLKHWLWKTSQELRMLSSPGQSLTVSHWPLEFLNLSGIVNCVTISHKSHKITPNVLVFVFVHDSSAVLWRRWNQNVSHSLTHYMTRSPMELYWTASWKYLLNWIFRSQSKWYRLIKNSEQKTVI